MPAKNQVLRLTCENFGTDAAGVCRADGMAVFVPGLIPGEEADVRIVKTQKNYAFGRLERLIVPSADRREPPCPSYKRCGGCSCQHMTYEASLEYKRTQVQELLRRVGGLDVTLPPVVGMEDPWHYRNKGTYPASLLCNRPVCGFFAPRSHDLIPLPEDGCLIQRPESTAAVHALLRWMEENAISPFSEVTGRGQIRNIMTRTSREGGTMVTLISASDKLPKTEALISAMQSDVPGLSGLCLLHNPRRDNVLLSGKLIPLWGASVLPMTLCGLHFDVSPLAFFQVNPVQTEKLYSFALDFACLTGSETVVDAYCGAGTISLLLAKKAKKVIGIEIVPEAIENAKKNALVNHVSNTEFLCGPTELLLPQLAADGIRPDAVVLDPPRKGCELPVLDAIAKTAPQRVVYVSCGAPALARDAKLLAERGYELTKVICVDMFCWTGDVETVACFCRKS